MKLRRMKLQHKIALLSIGMMCLVLVIAGALVLKNAADRIQASVGSRALAIGQVVAGVPAVQAALLSDNPSEVLQPFAERWRQATGAAFIIISNMEAVRLSYPVPSMIGTHMAPLQRDPVLRGEEYIYIGQGNLAPSLRANVPIFDPATNQQIGFVSVGFYLDDIYTLIVDNAGKVLIALLGAMAFSVMGAFLLAKNVKQATFGLEPHEIATILRERVATLEAIREGVIAVDTHKTIRVLNAEAAKTLGLDTETSFGISIDTVLPGNKLAEVMRTGISINDEEQKVQDVIIMANSVPIIVDGTVVGAVVSFRDRTEITRLAEELTGVHRFVDVLRAQAHEFKNKLHTIAGLIQLKQYEDAVNFAIESQILQEGLFAQLSGRIKDSVIFGLLAGKASQMKEKGIDFSIDAQTSLQELPVNVTSGDIVLILGNLLQNAVEAVALAEKKSIWASIRQDSGTLAIKVFNSGPWIEDALADSIYRRGVTTKKTGSGLGLALIADKLRLVNGEISHRNQASGGVEFTVSIPYGRG